MSYDYKKHWQGSNFGGGPAMGDWLSLVRKHLIPGSVLDVGCAGGRFVDAFEGHDYIGLDISAPAIGTAMMLYPKLPFFVLDVVTMHKLPQKRESVDNIFTWTVLEHIPPEHVGAVAEKLTRWAKNLVLVEPIPDGTEWAAHCFPHDYEKLFDIQKKERVNANVYLMQAKGEA